MSPKMRITAAVLWLLFAVPAALWAQSSFDKRDGFQVSAFTGIGIDTFAADDLAKYLNPDDSSKPRGRQVAGIDFEYRVKKSARQQLWFYGETVHGMRSADVDCEKNAKLATCQDFRDPTTRGDAFLFLLRNASSLEAYAGVRWELASINASDEDSAGQIYVKLQAGFLSVEGSGSDVSDQHHIGVGIAAVSGRYSGSYLEVGFGRSDLYYVQPRRRLKIDGLISLGHSTDALVRPFVQMTVDSDLGKGGDSIQTYIGLDIDLNRIFKKP